MTQHKKINWVVKKFDFFEEEKEKKRVDEFEGCRESNKWLGEKNE